MFHKYLSAKGLPPIIEAKCRATAIPGFIFMLFGVIILITGLVSGNSLGAALLPEALGLALVMYAAIFKYSAVSKGIIEIAGTCDRHCHIGIQSIAKIPATGFGLNAASAIRYEYRDGTLQEVSRESVSGIVYVPISKRKNIPYVGQSATVYVTANAISYEDKSGMTNYNSVLAYTYGQ